MRGHSTLLHVPSFKTGGKLQDEDHTGLYYMRWSILKYTAIKDYVTIESERERERERERML